MIKPAIFLTAMLLSAAPAWAINKCTGPDGKTVFQDAPCAGKGEKIEVKPASGNAPVAPAPAAVASGGSPAPVPAGTATATPAKKEGPYGETWRRKTDLESHLINNARGDLNAHLRDCDAQQRQLASKKSLARLSPAMAEAARTTGVLAPTMAKEIDGQDDWKSLGLPDLREMPPSMAAPDLLAPGATVDDAVQVLREALGVPANSARFVETPTGKVAIFDKLLTHVVEKRLDRRERFGAFVLPTLQQPDEVWETAYDDATTRRRFIKLFSDSKYDLLVIVREGPDGAVLWNVLNRERKAMNTMRTGRLVHGHGRKAGDDVG